LEKIPMLKSSLLAGSAAMLAVLLASPVQAQAASQPPAGRAQRQTDANNDGVISYGEFMAARQQSFARLDRDSDGYLDSNDSSGRRTARRGGDRGAQRTTPLRLPLDTDQDGRVSQQEFVDAGEKQFNSLDADHDGNLTAEERKAVRQARSERRKSAR
jgi:opacity protein-like surface antigen